MTTAGNLAPKPTENRSPVESGGSNGYPSSVAERWLPVVGYEGLYDVSDQGRVRSLFNGTRPRTRSYVLAQQSKDGYRRVYLYKDGKSTKRSVHQLVLEAFVGERPPGCETRHLNSIRHDNRLENLTWGTRSENCKDRFITGNSSNPKTEMWNR